MACPIAVKRETIPGDNRSGAAQIGHRLRAFLFPLCIICMGFLVYANTFDVPFSLDCKEYIVDNPAIKDFRYFTDSDLAERAIALKKIDPNFRTRKLAFFTFALNYRLHGLNLAGYHVVNLLIHLASCLLVYGLVLATLRTPWFRAGTGSEIPGSTLYLPALLPALVFAVHPVQTEAVTYISQRFTSLATMLYLLALLLYIYWRLRLSPPGTLLDRGRPALYCLALLATVLAMFTKEIAFTLPLVLIGYEWMFFGRPARQCLWALLPFVATMLIIPAIIFSRGAGFTDVATLSASLSQPGGDNPALSYLFTQFRVIVTYLRLLILPIHQNLDYDYPRYASFLQPPVLASFAGLCLLAGLGIFLLHRSSRHPDGQRCWLRLVSFGIFWFFVTLSVESSIIPLQDLIFEHRLYLPSVGFVLALLGAIMLGLPRFGETWRRPAFLFLVVGIAVVSVATFNRNSLWRDPIALWEDTARKSPGKFRPNQNLGVLYRTAGRLEKAVGQYQTALRTNPEPVDALYSYNGLEQVYLQQGNEKELQRTYAALKAMLLQALAKPGGKNPLLFNQLGFACMKLNQPDEAEAAFRKAIDLEENNAIFHFNLGGFYLQQHRLNEALSRLRGAILLDPDNAVFQEGLGDALVADEKFEEAVTAYQRVQELDPRAETVLLKLTDQYARMASLYLQQRQLDKALAYLRQASLLDPDNPDILYIMGYVNTELGNYTEAIPAFKRVLSLSPSDIQAQQQLERAQQLLNSSPYQDTNKPQ